MKESGFYKMENGSYEYVCGGKIVFDSETDLNKHISTLIISEADKVHEIGSREKYREENRSKGKPSTYVIFDNVKSINTLINVLKELKGQLEL